MSLYHLNVSSISKANGSSAVASAAYRSCSVMTQNHYDNETGIEVNITHDYSRKKGLEFSQIFAPSDLASWCYDREELWNNVEESETRTNARYARDIKLALQKEFTIEQNIELLSEFVNDSFVSEGIIADVNIHIDNEHNPHAHIMLTTRNLEKDENGHYVFGKKNRLLDTMSWLHYLRKRWADINNKYFAIYDIDKSITHESYATRGFEYIIPTIHEGAAKHISGQLERIQTNKDIVKQNLDFIKENPLEVIKSLTKNKAVFSKIDLAKELDSFINEIALRDVNDPELIDAVKVQVISKYDELYQTVLLSDELVKICDKDINDRTLYTTKAQLTLEKEFLNNIDELNEKQTHNLNITELKSERVTLIDEMLARFTNKQKLKLSDEQQNAILNIVNGKDISLLIGRPGTGKSTVMSSLVKEYTDKGYNVFGAAHSAVATINLADAAGIKASTLSKWQYDWNLRDTKEAKGEVVTKLLPNLTNKDVLIIDEMSMVDLKTMNYFISKAKDAGSKIIFVGDDNQFSAVGLAGASDKLVEKVDNVVLNEVFRQKRQLDKEITNDLANFKVDEAIHLLNEDGRFTIENTETAARHSLVSDYISYIKEPNNANKDSVIIAYKNDEVKALNEEIRERLIASGKLYTKHYEEKGKEFYSASGNKKLAIGERLVFTKNDKRFGVVNGNIAVVTKIIDDNNFEVQTLGENKQRSIIIDTRKYGHYDYGYAITAYKSQGKTYDNTYVLLDKSVGYESFNVMATRHREDSQFYVDGKLLNNIMGRKFDLNTDQTIKYELTNKKHEAALFELLVRRDPAALAHDYIGYEQKEEIKLIKSYINARDEASENYRELLYWQEDENRRGNNVKAWDHEELWGAFQQAKDTRNAHAKELIEGYKDYRKYISSSTINYGTLLKHSGEAKIDYDNDHKSNKDNHKTQHEDLITGFEKLTELHANLTTNYNKQTAKNLAEIARELIVHNEHYKQQAHSNIKEINELKEEILQLDASKKAHASYKEDFNHYLGKTFKDSPEKIINNYESLKKEIGAEKALEKIEKDPQILGKLTGFGIGKALSITDKHAEAVFNTKSLKARLESIDSSKEEVKNIDNEIVQKEGSLKKLNEQYIKVSSFSNLTTKQELYLHKIQEHEKDLSAWINSSDAIRFSGVKVKLNDKEQDIKIEKNLYNMAPAKYNYKPTFNASEIHDKLAETLPELASQLLPNISDKNIEVTNQHIRCGSLHISLEANKKGLWYRFSRDNEKGNLFDLIELSKNLDNKKEAIEWGKEYLGLGTNKLDKSVVRDQESGTKDNKHDKQLVSKDQNKEAQKLPKVLMPVPNDAEKFNPSKTLYHKLRDNKHELEGVYEYKNIKNELCGYVVRIKDADNNKATLPIVYTENSNDTRSWRSKGFGDNRCLYNEHKLAENNKPILIVEGEKTADAAQSLYPEVNVVSWSGGASGYKKTDWSILKGKDVTIWPDNDKPGMIAATGIKKIIEQQGNKATIINPASIGNFPEKWDLADKLPNNINPHQITGALFTVVGIDNATRIDRTAKEYMQLRKVEEHKLINEKSFDNLGEYLVEKNTITMVLHKEESLIRQTLEIRNIIDSADQALIGLKASMHHNENYLAKIGNNSSEKHIEEIIKTNIASIFTSSNKETIANAVKSSNDHVNNFVKNHNSTAIPEHIIGKVLSPHLVTSLAIDIMSLHNKGHDIENPHVINNVIKSFNNKIEHEKLNFEQHQLQLQTQMIKQKQAEM
jgi:Ti-type conjugative transfer relaxase TraA